MKIQTTKIYDYLNNNQDKQILVFQGGSRCFTGNTLIKTKKGYVKIKDIQVGDIVLSFNEETKRLVWSKVLDTFVYNTEQKLIKLKLKGETISSTYDHKFYSNGQWTEAYKLKDQKPTSKEYKLGTKTARELNPNEIISSKLFIKKVKVYDIEVETKSYCITKNNYIVHNSGKTYNILIWIILNSLIKWENKIIDIYRKTFPSLRGSVMFDFFEILKKYELYREEAHNKSEHTYRIKNNVIRFGSIDQETKVRGAKRDILFLNEANEFQEDDFKQLNQRTTQLTILDYNPSDEFHWIYDKIIPRKDTGFFKTTYKDNPFIPERVRREIEAYKGIDENYWKIYGLGERGLSETTIFNKWDYSEIPTEHRELFGLDFGYNHPTALVKTYYSPELKQIVSRELLYKSGLTSTEVINELKKLVKSGDLKYTDLIIADSSRPEMIDAIYREGFNIHPTEKGQDSILRGINFIKINKLMVTKDSINLVKELKSYKWKVDKTGQRLDVPVEINDDLIDALRYSLERESKGYEKPRIKFG